MIGLVTGLRSCDRSGEVSGHVADLSEVTGDLSVAL